MENRKELVTWQEVERLVDHLIPQFNTEFDSMVIVTRGGIIPGGLLCEALDIGSVMTASVDFPFEMQREAAKLLAWPQFIQFPEESGNRGQKVLVVDDVWGSGRTVTAVKIGLAAGDSGLRLHFNPHRAYF
jgi:hypoxanthine phosphoribosyltransferase